MVKDGVGRWHSGVHTRVKIVKDGTQKCIPESR